ncbi:MAG: L,D-transpeptidase [Chroococcales cyanobacterium]
MKKILSRQFWQQSASVLVATSLAVTSLGVSLPQPVFANAIQERMTELQNSNQRWIEIDLSDQRLYAWEGGKQVYAVIVSTGKAATPTPTGTYTIHRKLESDRMRGPGYDVPNVPYAMYYHRGYAIHGTYWHNNFGTPVSHGCTNVATDHAEWLYNWAPTGTPVVVHQ